VIDYQPSKQKSSWVRWLTPAILATLEVEIDRIGASPSKKFLRPPS
jgi:hypothetical protein